MSKPRNLAASVRARLLNLAKDRGEDFQLMLGRWIVERFLFRLSISLHKNLFVLKGAMLFVAWSGELHRPTRDLDLLGRGSSEIVRAIRTICALAAEDGVKFELDAICGERIREDGVYEGVRVKVPAVLDAARVQLQIDVGFGDAIEPPPEERQFPVLLAMDAPRILAYPTETVIAEKLEAMVVLGIANSRMKDFYDIWMLARSHTFRLSSLANSIRATFDRRRTTLPNGLPLALTPEFLEDAIKQTQWRAFVNRLGAGEHLTLSAVGELLAHFLGPAIDVAQSQPGQTSLDEWTPPGPWSVSADAANRR